MALLDSQSLAPFNEARRLVLDDPKLYPQVVEPILPMIGASARLEMRRWGADFLAELFASPIVPTQIKEALGLRALSTLKDLLELPREDVEVLKSVIQAAASLYGLVFRYIIANPGDMPTWNLMTAIKSNILNKWDTAAPGVRICCIKFVQRVVQIQTPGAFDPRRPEKNEISLALVPRDHPLIPPSKLEPQASGLLDRLLNVFHEQLKNTMYVSATLNCLAILLRTRPFLSSKILGAILNFNPFHLHDGGMGLAQKLQLRSLEKTIRIFFYSILKRQEEGALGGRIKSYIDRLERNRLEVFAAENASRKRGLAAEPTDGLDASKRRRLGAEIPKQNEPPPLPSGPASFAQLFTLTDDKGLASFSVSQLGQEFVTRASLALLAQIEAQSLDTAINHVRSRYLRLSAEASQPGKSGQPGAAEEDEEDYEPEFEPSEDPEQIMNKADELSAEDMATEVALGPFKFPQPPPMTLREATQMGKGTIDRVFGMMSVLDEASPARRQRPGLNRLAGSNYDREAWLTIITRLATRTASGSHEKEGTSDSGDADSHSIVKRDSQPPQLSEGIRELLWRYILEDFRARIGVAITWLNEEWYSDRLTAHSLQNPDSKISTPLASTQTPNYDKWSLKVLDGILPYLDAKDKLLIRFLSEIPLINTDILNGVKSLAKDPERVDLAVKAIHYLILMKPPARELSVDAAEDLWRNFSDAKGAAAKVLMKWRPHVLAPAIAADKAVSKVDDGQAPSLNPRISSAPATPKSEAVDDHSVKNEQTGTAVAAAG